jgi:hypothetical protein
MFPVHGKSPPVHGKKSPWTYTNVLPINGDKFDLGIVKVSQYMVTDSLNMIKVSLDMINVSPDRYTSHNTW